MPSNYENVRSISRIAGEDLTEAQYRFLKVNSDGEVVKAGNGERAIGVSIGKAEADKVIEVGVGGRVLVELGATVAAGAVVQSDASGKCITQASTGIVCGTALEGGAAGEIVSVLFDAQGAP